MADAPIAPAFLVRIPISDRAGHYACHRKVYEICDRSTRPLWRRCPGYILALTRVAPESVESRPYSPAPTVGQETRFDLVAEITAARRKEGQTESRRCDPVLEARFANPHRSYAELAADIGRPWLERRGQRLGFELLDLHRCEYEVVEFVRQSQPLRVGAVRYAGRLRVTGPTKFTSAMLDGIGHGKAWGCGLLLCFGV